MGELNQLMEFTHSSLQENQKLIDNIDTYLKQIRESCDLVTSESSKDEFIYQNEKSEIIKFIEDLESEKQILWVRESADCQHRRSRKNCWRKYKKVIERSKALLRS